MTQLNLTALVQGQPNSASDVNTSLAQIQAAINGNLDTNNLSASAGILGTQLSASAGIVGTQLASATITDTQLASPNNSTQKAIFNGGGLLGTAVVGTYVANSAGGMASSSSYATTTTPPLIWVFTTADHAVTSKTTTFRTDLQVAVGSTSPSTVVLTAGLYPLTIVAGNYTLGTVVTGSTIASSALATNTVSKFSSSGYAASALTTATPYVLAVAVTSITVPAGIAANVQLVRSNT